MSQMLNKLQSQFTSSRHESQSTLNQKPGEKSSFISSNIHELLLSSSPQRLKVRYKVKGTSLFPFFSSELQWNLEFTSSAWSCENAMKTMLVQL